MITVNKKATIAAISELRNRSDEILRNAKDHPVILEKHSKPVVVMLDYGQYANLEKILDYAEDYILGMIALEREKSAKPQDYVDMEKW